MAQSCNKFRNPPHIDHYNASRHAEAAALARCTNGDTAYVARVDRYGQTRLARPCEKCSRDLLRWGIRVVVFTSEDGGYLVEKIAA
jgi:deoxycytidylate deaminase